MMYHVAPGNITSFIFFLSQRFGIEKGDIAKHPQVLTIFPATIENHTMLLEEGGFSCVTAHHLVKYVLV
jgi:hypothetical protein